MKIHVSSQLTDISGAMKSSSHSVYAGHLLRHSASHRPEFSPYDAQIHPLAICHAHRLSWRFFGLLVCVLQRCGTKFPSDRHVACHWGCREGYLCDAGINYQYCGSAHTSVYGQEWNNCISVGVSISRLLDSSNNITTNRMYSRWTMPW